MALRATLPRLTLPAPNAIEPVAVPPNCPITVAVKVTDCPETEGFSDDLKVTVELALFTVSVTAAEVLPARSESPL